MSKMNRLRMEPGRSRRKLIMLINLLISIISVVVSELPKAKRMALQS